MTVALAKSNAIAESTVTDVEARRLCLNIDRGTLCHSADVDPATYWRVLHGHVTPQRRTLVKLSRALDRLERGQVAPPPPSMVAAFWRVAVAFFARELGADPMAALNDRGQSCPENAAWLAGSRARQLAFYVTHVDLGVSHSALAGAIGTSKQRVHKAVARVEDLRDALDLDALLDRASTYLSGRLPPASTGTFGKGIVP